MAFCRLSAELNEYTPICGDARKPRSSNARLISFHRNSHTVGPVPGLIVPASSVSVVTAAAGEPTQWCAGRRWYSKISPLIAQKRNPTPMTISHHNRNAVATATSDADSARVNGQ